MKKIFLFIAAFLVFIAWVFIICLLLPVYCFFALFLTFSNKNLFDFKIMKIISGPERFIYFCFDYLIEKYFL